MEIRSKMEEKLIKTFRAEKNSAGMEKHELKNCKDATFHDKFQLTNFQRKKQSQSNNQFFMENPLRLKTCRSTP